MTTSYDNDVVAWAEEQVQFLDTACFKCLDVKKIREILLAIANDKNQELLKHLSHLLASLACWSVLLEKQNSWVRSIIECERQAVLSVFRRVPSLKKRFLSDEQACWTGIWSEAVRLAQQRHNISNNAVIFPDTMPWHLDQILEPGWFPESLT